MEIPNKQNIGDFFIVPNKTVSKGLWEMDEQNRVKCVLGYFSLLLFVPCFLCP